MENPDFRLRPVADGRLCPTLLQGENPNFRLKPVAEFLDGNHKFFIPSYQRGYRWDKKQVQDLLKDIWDFAKKPKEGEFYCLQPIVVKEKIWEKDGKSHKGWEVIDGQQRLTTLLLLLRYLQAKNSECPKPLFELYYKTRPTMDFSKLNPEHDIDSFYAYNAYRCIENWFNENTVKKSYIEEVLFDPYTQDKKMPQVKFIWYVVENENDLDSIKVFNNLNKGKIKLTNAELIKALFVLRAKEEKYPIKELMFEWNVIENSLHSDKFWLFLTNKNYTPSTRIDLIFDFFTGKKSNDDEDYSYRKFQNLYDNQEKSLNINTFEEAWKCVKSIYQMFLFWYENELLYHYIGYLLTIGVSHKIIFDNVQNLPKNVMVQKIKSLIKEQIKISAEKIRDLTYNDQDKVREVLLLFNVESCTKSNAYRFPFDLYKQQLWDIEHIASQTDNKLQKTKDKIIWLDYAKTIICDNPEWPDLKRQAISLVTTLKETNKDEGDKFSKLYSDIITIIEPDDEYSIDNKDSIGNLTLLDAGTNRGYGNALFQTKRKIILDKDSNGFFIPPCTKNIFLKYYSADRSNNLLWKNVWLQTDADSYIEKIMNTINEFIN